MDQQNLNKYFSASNRCRFTAIMLFFGLWLSSIGAYAICVDALTPYFYDQNLFELQSAVREKIDQTQITEKLIDTERVREVALKSGWPEDQINTLIKMVREIDRLIVGPLKYPADKTAIFQEWNNNAFAMSSWDMMVLPSRFSFDKLAQRASPDHVFAIWAHEYGHLIFYANLKIHPRFTELLKGELSLDQTIAQVKKANERLTQLREIQKSNLKAIEKFRLIAALMPSAEELSYSKKQKDKANLQRVATPYNELFADLVAVVYLGDGAAIEKGLVDKEKLLLLEEKIQKGELEGDQAKSLQQFVDSIMARNFKREIDVEKWMHREAHVLLSPTRHYIYKQILPSQQFLSDPAGVLKIIFDACAEEIALMLHNGIKIVDPVAANKSLIERIESLVLR